MLHNLEIKKILKLIINENIINNLLLVWGNCDCALLQINLKINIYQDMMVSKGQGSQWQLAEIESPKNDPPHIICHKEPLVTLGSSWFLGVILG